MATISEASPINRNNEMNTTIQIFENAEFGKVRTMQDAEGEPLFCAKDVAVALGYGNSREALRKHVEQEDVTKRDTPTAGGTQQMQYVNESGLYALILGRGAVADVEQLEETRIAASVSLACGVPIPLR